MAPDLPMLPTNPIQEQPKPNLLPKIILAVITLLLIAGTAFAVYYFFGQKGVSPTVPSSPVTSTRPVQVEQVKGKVTAFKDGLLTVTRDDGQQEIIKTSPRTTILKPKKLNFYASSSIPTDLNIGNIVSVQSIKNPNGDLDANTILVLEETATKSAALK